MSEHDPITGLTLTLLGTPRAQPRARHIPGRRRPISNTDPKARAYKTALEQAARVAVDQLGGPALLKALWGAGAVVVWVRWVFPTNKHDRWGALHTPKPDTDNLEKMLLDCLMRAGALGGDDARVADVKKTKLWGEHGGMWVTVMPAPKGDTTREALPGEVGQIPGWLK